MALIDLLKIDFQLNGKSNGKTAKTDAEVVAEVYSLTAAAGLHLGTAAIQAAIYQDDDAHDTCTLTACLNPLHPGPCKGWKHSLFTSAPAAWHALEASRVEKANGVRLKKIEALKSAGKPIPHKLLQPIVAKPHPHAGKTANAATGEAHQAGMDVSANAGVHINEPGKVTLGKAVKSAPGTPVQLGPKGKKPTVASKGIAHVIAQDKVTPQYKLDKAASITPEQWSALSEADQSSIRGELSKISINGFGKQEEKANELLAKLPAGAQPNTPAPKLKSVAEHQAENAAHQAKAAENLPPIKTPPEAPKPVAAHKPEATSPMAQKVQAVKAEVANGSTLAEAIKKVNEHQANNAQHQADAAAEALKQPIKLPEPEKPKLGDTGKAKPVTLTAVHNGHTYTKKTAVPYTHMSATKVPGHDEPMISWHKSEAAAHKGNLTGEQKKNGFYVSHVVPVTKEEAPKTEVAAHKESAKTESGGVKKGVEDTKVNHPQYGEATKAETQKLSPLTPPPSTLPEGATSMAPGHLGNLIHKQGGSADVVIGGKKIEVGFEGGNKEAKLTFTPKLGTGSGGYTITTKDGEKYHFDKNESVTVVPKADEVKAPEAPKPPTAEKLKSLGYQPKPKPLPAHVNHAIDMANGHAPGATWSKNHLAAYQPLSAEEYKALPPDVQDKIISELTKGQSKFLDPKKVKASQDLIEKFKGAGGSAPKAEVPKVVGFVQDLHNHDISDAQAKKTVAGTPYGTQFLAAKQIAGLTDAENPDANGLHTSHAAASAEALVEKYTKPYDDGTVLNEPGVKAAVENLAQAAHQQAYAQSVLSAKQKAFSKIVMKTKGGGPGLSPIEKATLDSVAAHMLEHQNPDTSVSTMDKLKADTKSAETELDHALQDALKKVNAPKAEGNLKPAGLHSLTDYDKTTISEVYSNSWSKHASKAVTYGFKGYDDGQKMQAHPDYAPLTQNLGDLKAMAGKLAVAHAKEHTLEQNVPTNPVTGDLEHGSPEWIAWQDAVANRVSAEKQFSDLHKLAQARLDTIRASIGLKKRALPKLDTSAVKASAAESGFYKSTQYSGPNYGKYASGKGYMLAKVGPKIGVKHQSPAEKAAVKTAKVVEKSGGMPAPKVHVKPPSSEVGKGPNPETAGSLGYHYTPKVANDPHGQGWPGTGSAYVSSPEQLASLQEHLAKSDTKFGLEAQKQFKWSINNMESKGAAHSGKSALYDYTGSGYDPINSKLNGLPPGAKSPGGQISSIDAAFASSPPLEGDVVLYRGFKSPNTVFSSGKWNDVNVAGVEWTQRSYSSTSGKLSTAQSFGDGGVVMRIIIPKEMNVHGINAKGGQHPGENEIILQRGLRYRVVADHGKHSGTRYIDVMVVPSPYGKPK